MAAENSSTAFHFIQRPGRSEKLVAEVEIVFGDEAGVLSGMKLVGVCIWRSDMGQLFVTLPAKPGKSQTLRPSVFRGLASREGATPVPSGASRLLDERCDGESESTW